MSAPEDELPIPAARIVPRKLSFRVNGARVGAAPRPVETDAAAVAVAPSPPQRFGMRTLAPRPTVVALDPGDYATASDYE